MRLKSLLTPSLFILSLGATPAFALDLAPGGRASTPDEAGSAAATAVSAVVVTANRAPVPVGQVGQSFTILTASRSTWTRKPTWPTCWPARPASA